MATALKMSLAKSLRELSTVPLDQLVERRYQKFRRHGVYEEGSTPAET
jgi:acetyl-CoA carboxylase alpha subunit